jgi:hypothetical protein
MPKHITSIIFLTLVETPKMSYLRIKDSICSIVKEKAKEGGEFQGLFYF